MGRIWGFAAALCALTWSGTAIADTARVSSTGHDISRAMIQEHRMLRAAGGARVAELSRTVRPPARDDAAVTVASRSVDPGVVAKVAEVNVRALDAKTLDSLPSATGDAQWACLAEAIYFESRGEPLAGQVAVAEVILNRVRDHEFPNSVCGVTKQGAGSGRGCQFSYACDGNSDVMKSAGPRERSEKLAALMLASPSRTLTDGAVYFHTRAVRPSWAAQMTRTTTIGHHIFYRSSSRVASN
jgi:spore germination cell wall hydrolase CwlJ-like protein